MIGGSVELYDRWVAAYVADGGVPMLHPITSAAAHAPDMLAP
jgi:hypothetical protein